MTKSKNEKDLIYKDGIKCAKSSYALFENLLIIIQISLGAYILHPIAVAQTPWASTGYVIFAILMLGFVLRKHLCTKCYYYGKLCHCGWGILASKLYKKDSGNYKLGGSLAGLTWGLIMLVPIIGAVYLYLSHAICIYFWWPFYGGFLFLVIINLYLHKKDCQKCKMRYVCPGSAAKK